MLDELEGSLKAQRQLVADASHELRTPLHEPAHERRAARAKGAQGRERTALLGGSARRSRADDPRRRRHRALPRRESEHAARGRCSSTCSCATRSSGRRGTPRAPLRDRLEAIVRGAPERLYRAVANLLDNAAKWSPAGRRRRVAVRGGEVSVRDHGLRSRPRTLPYVFDRFYRAATALASRLRARPRSCAGSRRPTAGIRDRQRRPRRQQRLPAPAQGLLSPFTPNLYTPLSRLSGSCALLET